MGRIIDISSRLDTSKPILKVGDKEYPVNNTLETMVKMEELMTDMGNIAQCEKAIEIALGAKAAKELNVIKRSFNDFKIIIAAIMALIQDTEDIDKILNRFQPEAQ